MCRGGFLQTLRLREERSHNQSLAVENGLILLTRSYNLLLSISDLKPVVGGGGGRVLPYMGYIGMCRCEGYGFQAVYSRIGI